MNLRILLLSYILFSNLSAVGEAGAIFLLISPGAGPQATGEAQVAKANDAYASYYNPAGFGFLKGREATGMHVQWLPNLADDLFYEFIAYRHYIEGLGSVGGHIIFLNLGEQIGMNAEGDPTGNWRSFMAAFAGSIGTQLTPTSSIGFNFKVFHQKLSDQPVEGEEGEGYSTDFGFDIGYLKKFTQSEKTQKLKKGKKIKQIFNQFTKFYDQQIIINEKIYGLLKNESNIYDIIEDQEILMDEIEIQKEKLSVHYNLVTNIELDKKIIAILNKMEELINILNEISIQDSSTNYLDDISTISDKISFEIMDIESKKVKILSEIEEMEIKDDNNDTFNLGFCISNIGPKIDFVNADQADPSPMNMRMGLFAQLYNDGNNKLNFLFDANKLLVSRYPDMDWNGDGEISDEELAHDEPWYKAIFTAWLDDWYLGGDIDYSGDKKIGGYDWIDDDGSGNCIDDELIENPMGTGIYGDVTVNGECKIEKGSGNNRSFTTELKEMIYNVGLEYWYTDNFALRVGYIYDDEGKVINPTFGAGIRLLQYGFDFGYTAGETGHPRANTMFFSINMEL